MKRLYSVSATFVLMWCLSMQVFAAETSNTSDLMFHINTVNFIVSVLLTITVYSLPIMIYRFAIRRAPVDKRKAKIISIIYGIAAFLVMTVIVFLFSETGTVGGSIILWSWINYRMLIHKPKDKSNENTADGAADGSMIENKQENKEKAN